MSSIYVSHLKRVSLLLPVLCALTAHAQKRFTAPYVLAADATDNAPPNFLWFGANGSFTLETLIKLNGSNSLPADFLATNGDFALGNDARSALGENEGFPGLLDEVRISSVARAPTDFLFRAVKLAGASGSDGNLPENTLDANFGTRWSAFGDGQWISYDLGSTQVVAGIGIAFYSGNTRTGTFDVQEN